MSWFLVLTAIGIVLIAQLILGVTSTQEAIADPRLPMSRKLLWLGVVWLVPIVGPILLHKALGLGRGSGKQTEPDPTGGDTVHASTYDDIGGDHNG